LSHGTINVNANLATTWKEAIWTTRTVRSSQLGTKLSHHCHQLISSLPSASSLIPSRMQ
jgi:hypothetical protein